MPEHHRAVGVQLDRARRFRGVRRAEGASRGVETADERSLAGVPDGLEDRHAAIGANRDVGDRAANIERYRRRSAATRRKTQHPAVRLVENADSAAGADVEGRAADRLELRALLEPDLIQPRTPR